MSVSICTECLSRLRVSRRPTPTAVAAVIASATSHLPQVSSFHTSAQRYASPLKKKANPNITAPKKGGAMSFGKKNKKNKREKPSISTVGERKAARKRIVLSNTNALVVSDLETLSAENMASNDSKGKVLALDGQLLDQLRDSEAFKTTQNWNMFRRPATLVRAETVDLAKNIEEVATTKGKSFRYLVTGERLSGKSTLMLQTMAMAFMKNWVVINVPEAQDFVINTSSYKPLVKGSTVHTDAGKPTEQLYLQQQLAQKLLTRIANANEIILSELRLNHHDKHPEVLRLQPGATLKDVALVGSRDHTIAVRAWQALWRELNTPGANPRPPVLIAVDGADHWFGLSKYYSTDFELLHAQQFLLVKQLTDLFFSGDAASPLTNGGMMLFTTSGSNSPRWPHFESLLKQLRAKQQGVNPSSADFPLPGPYSKPDQRVTSLLSRAQGVKLLDINGTSKDESKAILEYFARSGLLQQQISDKVVAELRVLSAGGILGELARLGTRVKA